MGKMLVEYRHFEWSNWIKAAEGIIILSVLGYEQHTKCRIF